MKVKELRLSTEMTQEQLAEKLNVTRSSVAMWENGEALPRADKLPELAKIFGCSIDDLFVKEGITEGSGSNGGKRNTADVV